ncbi:hypothetical protein GCM10020295_65420 [Streptomyces cinereospinus]
MDGMSQGPRSGLAAISAALLAMSRHLEVRDVLKTIVASARELLDAEYAALGVPDDHGGFAQFVVDGVSDEQWKQIGPLPRQHGVLAAMLRDATPQRLPDVRADPRFGGWPSAHPDLADFLGLPIRDGDEVIGALFLANKLRPAEDTPRAPRRTAPAASPPTTRNCCPSSPSTPRSPSPTPGSTNAAANSPSPRSAPAWPTNCTTRSARSSSPCA